MPTANQVNDILEMIIGESFSINEAKYIRHLAKDNFFNTTKATLGRLLEFCEKLKSEHSWEVNYDFFERILTSIVLFTPWSRNFIKYYSNPLIVDATFSAEEIRFTTCSTIDGEFYTQIIGIIIRATEDSKEYRFIFNMIKKELPNVYFTVIADMAPCIEKACKESFGDKYSLIYCLFHLKENFLKKFGFKTTTQLWKNLKRLM